LTVAIQAQLQGRPHTTAAIVTQTDLPTVDQRWRHRISTHDSPDRPGKWREECCLCCTYTL